MTDNFRGKLAGLRKVLAERITGSVVRLLVRTRISPNALTLTGFVVTVLAAALAAYGELFASGLVLLLAGFFDLLDGAVARMSKRVTRFGAALDSTLDRLSEAAVLLGIMVFFLKTIEEPVMPVVLTNLALIGSYMVSYVRARAEGLNLRGEAGISTRPERVAITALGLLLDQLIIALAVVAVMSFITAGQRLLYIWQQTRKDKY